MTSKSSLHTHKGGRACKEKNYFAHKPKALGDSHEKPSPRRGDDIYIGEQNAIDDLLEPKPPESTSQQRICELVEVNS